MTLLEQWRNSPTRRAELAELINSSPALRDAIEVLKEQGNQFILPPAGGTYSLIEFYGLYGAKGMGYRECLANLDSLTKIQPRKTIDRKPWESVVDVATAPKRVPDPVEPSLQ